jgi:hypothetical protein
MPPYARRIGCRTLCTSTWRSTTSFPLLQRRKTSFRIFATWIAVSIRALWFGMVGRPVSGG